MVIITLILCFSLWNMYQSQQLADISYIQRMTSLIIYQLEDDTSNPQAVLSNYESGTNVYSILENSEGKVLYQSIPDTATDFANLFKKMSNSISTENAADSQKFQTVTEQGGFIEMDGADHDHYYAIPATVSTKAGTVYTLALFYERTSIVDLLLREAPKYLFIWIVSLISILFISRFLLRKAFEPT